MLHQICIKCNIYWLISCIYVATLIKKKTFTSSIRKLPDIATKLPLGEMLNIW